MEQLPLLPKTACEWLGPQSGLDPASGGFAHRCRAEEVSNFEQSHDCGGSTLASAFLL